MHDSSLGRGNHIRHFKAADWSSEGTFQTFYHRNKDPRGTFGTSVLESAASSNLHVDMETEPSEM